MACELHRYTGSKTLAICNSPRLPFQLGMPKPRSGIHEQLVFQVFLEEF